MTADMSDLQSAAPACSVIIPHFNDVTRLRRCLDQLVPQLNEGDELIVADNGSTDDVAAVIAGFPAAKLVVEPQKGAGPARNRGVAAGTAPIILFIDADCVPAADWVETGRRIARDGHVIGGRVDVFDETPPPRSGPEAFEAVFAFKMQAYLDRDRFLGAGNLVTTRKVFDQVGGFRPAVSEDVEWSQRAAKAGVTLAFDDRFAVSHPSRSDWPALARKWRRLTSEAFQLRAASGRGRLGWAMRAVMMPASVAAHIPKVIGADGLSFGEKLRATGTLVRIRLARMVWMLGQVLTGRP